MHHCADESNALEEHKHHGLTQARSTQRTCRMVGSCFKIASDCWHSFKASLTACSTLAVVTGPWLASTHLLEGGGEEGTEHSILEVSSINMPFRFSDRNPRRTSFVEYAPAAAAFAMAWRTSLTWRPWRHRCLLERKSRLRFQHISWGIVTTSAASKN